MDTVPFKIYQKRRKYLEISLNKDINNENFKSLKKEIMENIRKWKDI